MINNEKVLFKGAANLIKGIRHVEGNIKITDNRFLFKSNNSNTQNLVTSIPLGDILNYKQKNLLGFNRLIIVTKKGIEYKFVVSKRKEIIEILNNNLSNK